MAMPRNAANSSNYRIGCSLFTDPNNYTNGSSFSFNAPVNNNSNLTGTGGTNYGCMGSVPNQAWFIITINTGGNLYFNYSNSNGYDVDAVVWGPLANNDVANACNATLNYPLTCDYDAARPDLYINNAQPGQKYVMLVTNFSNANTVINISQPSGGSVTYSMVNLPNCSLTPTASISGTSTTITEGQSATLSLSFTGSSPWNYTLSDGTTGTTYTSPVNVTVYPTASQTYTISSVNNLCGTSGGSGSVGVSVVRNVQLKSCFPLDGNGADSQGINSGSLQNGVTPTTNRFSETNKALQFDGIDDYINLPTNQLNNTTFGFATWVKLNALPTLGNPEQLALSLGSTGEQHYIGVEYANGSPTWKFYSNGITVYSNAVVNTDWHLLVGVRTGGQLKLYVDGNLTGISNTNGTAFYDSPLFGRIGSGIANNKFFNGKIDDVKIFNGALIDPEVMLLQNYNSCSNVFNDTYISVQSVSTAVICTGTSFIVRAFTNNLPIENDLQFIAELSDANGTFNNPTIIGVNQFLPLTVSIPNSVQGGNYKIRVRYGGYVSVNNFDIFVNNPSTYSVSGTVAINDGQSTNINLNFTGTGPWNYVLTNGLSGVATTNPWQITVTPDQSSVYAISTASNVCGTTTLNGNSSAIVTVNFTKQFVTCLPFSNNANDENGNNTATVNGPILTDSRYGQTNAAYSFNGNGNYIEYTTNLLRKREYTMSAWVLANSIPSGTQYIISQGETSTNTFQGLAMTSSGWVLQSYTSNGVYSVSSSTGFAANQWIHLTAVCSYQSLKLYINGNLVASASNSSFIPFKISDIGRIGASSSSLGNYFNGKIDDVRLYKGALNDDEVFALFSNTNNCPMVENSSIIVVRSLSPTTVCAGNNISVAYTSSNVNISAGSPLNVLLSDQNGSFANPTIIGSGSSTPISATIPNNIIASNFYRIRLVSTSGTPVNSINSSTLAISGSRPTATVSGGGSIQNGQSANITITFTGSAPWTYALNNGASQSTSTSPLVLPVSPFATTTYTVTSVSNTCGSGTSSGSATVTVAPFVALGSLNSAYCTGTNFSVPFQANFTPNNNFRVELSDAVGNFNNPISIGTGTISPITAQVPNNIASGTGYKIRIVSDSPAAISAASNALTINQKATATISGTTTINEGESATLTITFTGQGPWTYSISGGTSQTTSNNPTTVTVLPTITTTYNVTSISNSVCGTGSSSGSVTITVNPIPVRLISCFPFNGNANDGKGLNNGT
ncbi:MAG: LamG-like jellyroll fold domain-containing protein, partial [Emticicia sp.]